MLVVAIIGAVGAIFVRRNSQAQGRTFGKAEGKAEALLLGPQPFEVQLKQEFVTRREFEKLESRLEIVVSDMKGLFRETMSEVRNTTAATMKRIDGQNDRLTKKIEDIGTGAYHGRQKLWEQVNEQRERLAGIGATTDVATQIGRLADSLSPGAPKVQPTHPHNNS